MEATRDVPRRIRALGLARSGGTAAVLVATLACAGCGGRRAAEVVTIKGSDTMVILGQRWAEEYMAAHPGALVQVTGGGSGTGIAALINGTTDICQASRPMREKERKSVRDRHGAEVVETPVARDGIAVYLHEANPVADLTLAQLVEIYTGRVTRWGQVGGADAPIVLYGRENSSGTYEYFKEHVLAGADFAAAMQTLPGTAAVVSAVGKDPNGIGFGGAAFAKGVKECAVRPAGGGPGVLPTADNVRSGAYPISRALFFYTRGAPEGPVRAFIDYALSDEGQRLVADVGYFPIR